MSRINALEDELMAMLLNIVTTVRTALDRTILDGERRTARRATETRNYTRLGSLLQSTPGCEFFKKKIRVIKTQRCSAVLVLHECWRELMLEYNASNTFLCSYSSKEFATSIALCHHTWHSLLVYSMKSWISYSI